MHQTKMAPRRIIPPNSRVVRRLDFGDEEKNMQAVYDNILNAKREDIMSFKEKYNFDFEKEQALPGKYEWMMRNDLDKWIIMNVQDISYLTFSGRVTPPLYKDIATAETPTDLTAAVGAAENSPADTTTAVAAPENTPTDTTTNVAAAEKTPTDPTSAAIVEMTPTHSPATADAAELALLKKRAMPRDDRTLEKSEIAKDDKTSEKRRMSRNDNKNLVKKRLRME